MREIRVDRQRAVQVRRMENPRHAAAPRTPRCDRHPGVHMVLAGSNPSWNTIRYLCPLCNAMGRGTVEVATGVVTQYFAERGYGFIENGGPRIFFHVRDLASPITPYVGMPVTCQVEQNERGLIGRQVSSR